MALPTHELKALAMELAAAMPPAPTLPALGEFLEYDFKRIRRDATPKWRAWEGEGAGVPPAVLLELLDKLTQSLRDGEDEHDSLRWALKMLRQLLTRQESNRNLISTLLQPRRQGHRASGVRAMA